MGQHEEVDTHETRSARPTHPVAFHTTLLKPHCGDQKRLDSLATEPKRAHEISLALACVRSPLENSTVVISQ